MLEEHGEQFVQRTFAPAEHLTGNESTEKRAEHYAVRFACKEAVVKALGTGFAQGIALTEIEVRKDANGRPSVHLTGRTAQIASEQGIEQWHVSLTHTAGLAMASAIACGSA